MKRRTPKLMKLLIRSTRPTLITSKADDECESLPFQEDFFLLLHCFLMKGKPGAKVILEVVEKAKAKESQRAREEKEKEKVLAMDFVAPSTIGGQCLDFDVRQHPRPAQQLATAQSPR